MNIQEVARLNQIMNNLTMTGLDSEKIVTFIEVKEEIENIIDKYNADCKSIADLYELTFDEQGKLSGGDQENANNAFQSLYNSINYDVKKFINMNELVSMSQDITGGDLSFAKKMLIA